MLLQIFKLLPTKTKSSWKKKLLMASRWNIFLGEQSNHYFLSNVLQLLLSFLGFSPPPILDSPSLPLQCSLSPLLTLTLSKPPFLDGVVNRLSVIFNLQENLFLTNSSSLSFLTSTPVSLSLSLSLSLSFSRPQTLSRSNPLSAWRQDYCT